MSNPSVAYTQTFQMVNKDIQENLDRINPLTNPYLNKNILFSNGTVCYVTTKGVVKQYNTPSNGKNKGCPKIGDAIRLDFPWTVQYTPGTFIPTTPPLIVGTPMPDKTSCKHAGKNVYASELLTDAKSKYIGCYTSSSGEKVENLSPSQCKQYATDGMYKYFSPQDNNDCIVSNDAPNPDILSNTIYTPKTIWETDISPINGDTITAFVNHQGNMVVQNVTKTSDVWTSPNAPLSECSNGGNISIIDATYGGNCNIDAKYSVQNGNVTDKVSQIVKDAMDDHSDVFKYIFPVDNASFGDPAPGCNKSLNVNYMCGNAPFNKYIDNAEGKSAVISCTDTVNKCSFYLKVQDNGRLALCQGNPENHESNNILWSPTITLHVGDSNPNWVAGKGKTGKDYISTGETLSVNEWVGSKNGRIRFIMQSNGNLAVQTSERKDGCPNNLGINDKTNAWNEINNKGANKNDMGKVAYIDENLVRHDYSNSIVSTIYQQWNNFTSQGNDLGVPVSGGTQKDCESKCSGTTECKGYVWDGETQTCYPKSSIYPKASRTPRINHTLVSKIPVPSGACNMTPVPVDTVTFSSFENGKQMTDVSPCSASLMVSKGDMSEIVESNKNLTNDNISTINDINASIAEIERQNKTWSKNQMVLEQNQNKKEGMANMDDINGAYHNSKLYVASENYMFDALALIALGVTFVTASEMI